MKTLQHKFVTEIPETIEPDTIYVSFEFNTTSHLCCCGCGNRVVLKLSPDWWSLTYDGETVTFRPSIGNWELPCRSHYFITKSRVIPARAWTQEEIDAGHELESVEPRQRLVIEPPEGRVAPGRKVSLVKRILKRIRK